MIRTHRASCMGWTGQHRQARGKVGRLLRSAGRAPRPIAEALEDRRLLSVVVIADATLIEDGEALARPFGFEQLGESVRERQFVIANTGGTAVTLSDLQVPAGFRIIENIADTTLDPPDVTTDTTTFTIALDPTSTTGAKSGDVLFVVTDTEGSTTFNFAVEGTLTAAGGPHIVDFHADNRGGVWIDFDEALAAETITDQTVLVLTAGDDAEFGTDDDQAVAGVVTYHSSRRQVTFTPDAPVTEDYRVELVGLTNSPITALGGETLDGEYAGNFPTGNDVPGGSFHIRVDISERTGTARFDTVSGLVDILLTPGVTPITVDNFYNYADDGDWDVSFIHRSMQNFMTQGGGYYYANGIAHEVEADAPITNEFVEGVTTNIRGTIAMAKLGGNPNSATNQWFFNLVDNSDNLDNQNGGFTTFGSIIGAEGLETIDHIASLDTVNAGGSFTNLPLRDTGAPIDNDNLVVVERVASLVEYSPLYEGPAWTIVVNDVDQTDAAAFDFGNIDPNDTIEQTFLILNRGTEAVTITIASGLAAPFSMTPANGAGSGDDWVVQPTESFEFTVTFHPTEGGAFSDALVITSPAGSPGSFTVDLDGTARPNAPETLALAAASDTGVSSSDLITKLNNGSAQTSLTFNVTGVANLATVTIYANGTAIGSAVVPAGQTSVAVTTDGSTLLIDGPVAITATQTSGGAESDPTAALDITIDSIAPTLTGADDASVTQNDAVVVDLGSNDEVADLDPVYSASVMPTGAAINTQTGVINWTPTGAQVGVNPFTVSVSDIAGNITTRSFDITVLPLAPTGVDLTASTDTGSSSTDNITRRNNANPGSALEFRITGVVSGATVQMYAGLSLIGQAVVAPGNDAVMVTTDGTTMLADDTYNITAVQTLNGQMSNASVILTMTIDSVAPVLDPIGDQSTSAGQPYSLDLGSDAEQAGDPVTYSLPAAPAGATITPTTGIVSWVPLETQAGLQQFTAAVSDVAGNTATVNFQVEVLSTSLGPDGLSFSSSLTGRGSRREFIVQPTIDGVFIAAMLGVDPAAKVTVLYTDTGKKVVKPSTTKNALPAGVSFTGQAGVTYTIQVKAKGNAAGNFQLDVTYDADGRFQDATTLTMNQVDLGDEGVTLTAQASAAVNPRQDRDFYTFTPAQGGKATFVLATTAPLRGEITLYTGTVGTGLTKIRAAKDAKGTGQASLTATLTPGTQYFVEVKSGKGSTSGLYDLNVEIDANSSFVSPADLGDLDDALQVQGTLLDPKDDDWFSFTPTASGAFLFDSAGDDSIKMKITFVDVQTGQRLARSSGKRGGLPFGRFDVIAGREIRMLVEAKGNASGDYTINLAMDDLGSAAQAADLVFAAAPDQSELDPLTAEAQGDISSLLDQDHYTFTAPAGATTAFFAVSTTAGELVPNVTLYTITGGAARRIASAKDKTGDGTAAIRASLTPGTQYFLAVESSKGRSTGSYAINAEIDGNATLATADSLGTISAQTAVAGTILDKGDLDYFTFTAGQTGTLLLNAFAATGTLIPTVTLFSQTGQLLAKSKGKAGSPPSLSFAVQQGDVLYVLIQAGGKTAGDYTFNLTVA
ncbi:MAG: peptidylprolyl isomerase [Phycisphaerales bacterium]|nr:peptidylprolyl isomerase [Phycisphaerales bacterium]